MKERRRILWKKRPKKPVAKSLMMESLKKTVASLKWQMSVMEASIRYYSF
jgi:hypothetical protein